MISNKIFDLMICRLYVTKFLEGRERGKHYKNAKKQFLPKWRLLTYASKALIYTLNNSYALNSVALS